MNLNSTPLFEMLPKGAWGPSHLRVRTFAAPGLGKRRGTSLKVNAEAVTSPLPSDRIEHTGENIGASTTAVGGLPFGRKSPLFEGNRLKIHDFFDRKQSKSHDASEACQRAVQSPSICGVSGGSLGVREMTNPRCSHPRFVV